MVSGVPKPPASAAAAEFGRRLRQRRLAKKLTQLNLAHLAGCTVSAISNYENGFVLPKLETLLDIAYVLEIDPGKLISKLTPDTPPTDHLGRQ
jgi:transcriptional regulator with XRE-family HTH domain